MNQFQRDNLGRLRPIDSSGRFDNSRPLYNRDGYDVRTPYEKQQVRWDPPQPYMPVVLPKIYNPTDWFSPICSCLGGLHDSECPAKKRR